MSYRRVQLLLTPEQHGALKRLARQRRTSVSALVREMVARGLAQERVDWIARTRQVTQALLDARRDQPAQVVDAVDLVRSLREERGDALAPWATPRGD